MKKYIFASFIFGALFSAPLVSSAIMVADVDPSGGSGSCLSLENNLKYRMRDAAVNGEVSDLQDFLVASGYLTGAPSGYFGMLTLRGVKKFQSANSISPTGYVGAYTRAKIKETSCSGNLSVGGDNAGGGTKGEKPMPKPMPPVACTAIARLCPDGTMMPRLPNCEFVPEKCNMQKPIVTPPGICTMEARMCPDGTTMPRATNCEWLPAKCNSPETLNPNAGKTDDSTLAWERCRLDTVDGKSIVESTTEDQASCVLHICDKIAASKLPTTETRCIVNGHEVKRYTRSGVVAIPPSTQVIPFDTCRLDDLSGLNVTQNAIADKESCVRNLCDIWGPANLQKMESKCVYKGQEVKRYTKVAIDGSQPKISLTTPLVGGTPTVVAPTPASNNSNSGELHAVGVYQAGSDHSFCYSTIGHASVRVRNTGKPIVLSLSSYEPVEWAITLDPGATLSSVILSGYHAQSIVGLPSSVPVSEYFYLSRSRTITGVDQGAAFFYDARNPTGKFYDWASKPSQCPESAAVPLTERVYFTGSSNYFYAYQQDGSEYQGLVSKLKAITGLDMTSFQGAYTGTSFSVPKDTVASSAALQNLAGVLMGMQGILDSLKR